MTNSEIAKAMIDGEVFFNEKGSVSYNWDGVSFRANRDNAILNFNNYEFFRAVECPLTKWDDAIEHIKNLKGTMVIHGDNITVNVCATEDGLLDFARILLEGDEG